MSFKVSALLNPTSEPSSPKPQPSKAGQAPPAPTSDAPATADVPTARNASSVGNEAADALTGSAHPDLSPRNSIAHTPALAQSANGEHVIHSEKEPGARRASSYGSVAATLEPLSVDAAPEQHSPSLEQYHHRSKSPEEQRRQSLISMSSNPHVLPPLQTLETLPEGTPGNESHQPQDSSYGHDASHIVSVVEGDSSKAGGSLPDTIVQDREPDYVRDEPTAAQIRAPSPSSFPAEIPVFNAPSHSPSPQVKLEPSATSREPTPAQAALKTELGGGTLEVETLRAVASARNEHGLRGVSREASTATPSTALAMDPTPSGPNASKKRRLVDSKVRKKNGVGAKPGSKKRKVDDDQGRPSPTPSTKAAKSKASKKSATGTPVAGSSPAAQSSPPPNQTADEDEDDESGSDDGIYCICRKGDNHTWMIACDGSCQDWYHGKCVNVKESDGDLIEKYFCPRCTDAGEGYTTWKRMCRRDGCRRPARRDAQSKYCSDECGRLFFQSLATSLRGQAGAPSTSQKPRRERRKAGQADGIVADGDDTEDDGPSRPRGGTVSARDLKALTLSARDVHHFKDLGNSMLSPPATASPTSPTFTTAAHETPPLSGADAARVAEIEREMAALTRRLRLLKDRERMVAMAREQANAIAEREGVKPKDICGYDSRLNWSEGEFALWRASPSGRACFRLGTLDAEPEDQDKVDGGDGDSDVDIEMRDAHAAAAATGAPALVNGDTAQTPKRDGGDMASAEGDEKKKQKDQEVLAELLRTPPDVCLKKRCQRHTQWVKIAQYDVSFESSVAKSALQDLMADEREIRHRALVGLRKEKKSTAVEHQHQQQEEQNGELEGEGEDEGAKEGWVEVLG